MTLTVRKLYIIDVYIYLSANSFCVFCLVSHFSKLLVDGQPRAYSAILAYCLCINYALVMVSAYEEFV